MFFFKPPKPSVFRVLLCGEPGTGKTTLLYLHLLDPKESKKFAKFHPTTGNSPAIPTIGFNVESRKMDGKEYQFWDIGGSAANMYRLWCHYTAHVVLFTVTKPCISDWADRLSEIMFSRPGVPLVILCMKGDKKR
eukprot:TRINITY_DN33650_c0_g1_i1.p1 TRINITY_DN33650_c0_g1~~TRINITY_DN33650_c0_g1_i1.p1  ORF type:complete len:135 (+),score=10.19 TRINITY_DN33650_c0_g1_i1:126-530(+)